MALRAVFFDLDGTLLDTSMDLGNALNSVLEQNKLQKLKHEKIRPHVSNGAMALIKLGFGNELPTPELQKHRQALLDFYNNNIATHTKPFDGVTELIQALTASGIQWGIVTNKPALYTQELMKNITFSSEPVATVCPEHLGISKPDPAPLLHACKLAGCEPTEALYVGDHLRDIECGSNAKMPTIAVGYGFTAGDEHKRWGATHCVDLASEIWPLIREHY